MNNTPPFYSRGALGWALALFLLLAASFVVFDGRAGPKPSAGAWWEPSAGGTVAAPLKSVLGVDADEWKATGATVTAEDPSLGMQVMTVTNATGLVLERVSPVSGDRELRARLRFRTNLAPGASATLSVAKKDAGDPGLQISLGASRDANYIHCSPSFHAKPFHHVAGLTSNLNWHSPYSTVFYYYCKAYPQALPGWEEDYRQRVEDAMSRIPGQEDKWVDVRAELRKGSMFVWMEDRLVAWKQDPAFDPAGHVRVDLSPGMQIASFSFNALAPSPKGFLPLPLGGYHNARALLDGHPVKSDTLPPAGETVRVKGIPFVFSGVNNEGNDHIDVGQSLFRHANSLGYFPAGPGAGLWCGSTRRDPARIQVRLRNGLYDALYVIAAAEEKRDTVPVLSAMFYRPDAGFSETFETRVPFATADSSEATPLNVTLSNGREAKLWLVKIPLDPARLASFGDLDIVEIELTKQVHQYRNYPDPITYGWHQAGLPSSVHVYAMTLGEPPVRFSWEPDKFGHVWTAPEVPSYTATLANHTDADQAGKLTVTTKSYDGTDTSRVEVPVSVPKGGSVPTKVSLPVKLNGYHDVTATLDLAGKTWTEKRSLVRLAPDTRSAKWTEGKGAMFGYWSYHGGHHTPKVDHHVRLMTLAGARQAMHYPQGLQPETQALIEKHWGAGQGTAYYVNAQPWLTEEKRDPAKVEEFYTAITKAVDQWEKDVPPQFRPDHIYYFAEPHITPRLTAGNFPEYWNDPPFVYTAEEKERLKMFVETSRLASEHYRKTMPTRKLLIPWGDPGFVIPILRAGFPTNLVDGCGIDVPSFERLPEMQLKDNAVHRLYELRKEFEKVGIAKPRLQVVEGTFVPTEVGACNWREQMDYYTRWALIDMAYGVDRFYGGWFGFDCGNYYGAEHYGGCGIQRRIPYCDPKPAYASFATMTDKLNEANFDGWVKTGSLTTFCLRFKHATRGNIYALWTLRGKRQATLTLNADATVGITDSMNNTKDQASKDKKIMVMTDPSVIYITGAGEVSSVEVGEQDNSDSKPAAGAVEVADLGDGSWRYTSRRDEVYENNHWGFYPALGKFSATTATDSARGKVLVSRLEKQDRSRELMPWYNTLKPDRPIRFKGAPSHLGLWVKGASDWGRVVYILRDDKGERWISIGTKDDYNCDDVHSWSSFNFDGWRYLRFEMPGHIGYDNFRKIGTTWWGSSATAACSPSGKPEGDNIVDLPLTLEEIIVEQRTHVLYVNDPQPAASDTVSFGKMLVEYDSPQDATNEAVALSRKRMPKPDRVPELANPIARLQKEGLGAPTKLIRLAPPEHYYDGTRMHVHFTEVPGAKKYNLWVGPYEDGRGAVDLVPAGIKSGDLVYGLRPAVKLYYWITYTDASDKVSKPSPVHMEITVDNFKEK